MINIEKTKLNKKTPEENIVLVDKWISDTTDKLNIYLHELERKIDAAKGSDQSD